VKELTDWSVENLNILCEWGIRAMFHEADKAPKTILGLRRQVPNSTVFFIFPQILSPIIAP
jgi:hypothetical protein